MATQTQTVVWDGPAGEVRTYRDGVCVLRERTANKVMKVTSGPDGWPRCEDKPIAPSSGGES